jgi:glycosyltransferase involved in cell wall biosynthesis
MRTNPKTPRFDVVFYAPWASTLIGDDGRAETVAGGGEVQQFLLARALAARGLRVGMIVMGAPSALPVSAAGVHILAQAPRGRRRGPTARLGLAVGALRSMAGARTDVLIQRNAGSTTAVAAVAARVSGARFVYSSASVVDFEFAAFEPSTLNVRLYEWGIRRAGEIVVQTEEQARLCRARFGRDPLVIGSIAGRLQRRSGQPEAFLWVGKLRPVKRPEPYLELARALPEARFWMIAVPDAGESAELRGRVEAAVRELPNLELLEPRSRDGVGELLERTVAAVNTSQREGMPNVFLEGWARGVPALALSFDPGGLVATERLGSFAEGNPQTFEEQARTLWRGRGNQGAVAERCVAYVRANHAEDVVVDRWIAQALPGTARAGSSTS